MKAQNVEVYGGDYEHVLGISGAYHGIDVTYFVRPLLDIFETMLTERNYDACEFSLSNYIMLKAAGAEWLHAVPIFPYRAFRHSTLHVRRGSTLIAPAELRGKVVGVPDYSMTAAVWTRGILDEQYGVHWSEVRWVTNERQRFPGAQGCRPEYCQSGLGNRPYGGSDRCIAIADGPRREASRSRAPPAPPHC